jgi:adenylate kinase family enzyme
MIMVGRYVLVWGPSCSGKTTVARRISERIGVPHFEIDAIFWKPNWVETPPDELLAEVSRRLEENTAGWVFDGNYRYSRPLLLPLADTVVWLKLPFRVVFWRALNRTIGRIVSHEPLWGYNYETWRESFFSCDSLLLYIIKNWRRYQHLEQSLQEIPNHAELIRLRSQREVDDFIASLDTAK